MIVEMVSREATPRVFAENQTEVATKDFLASMSIYSTAAKLGKDETTEILESRKMRKDEIVVFEKLVDALSAFKEMRGKEDKQK
ncbi:MAG: hypothetical protein ABSA58_06545 [Acetobacteraceae bacterium]